MIPQLIPVLAAAGLLHLPHDNATDIACAPLAGGGLEIVAATNRHTRVLRSIDHGLSWQPVAGEGLGRALPRQVEYWPHPVTPRFFLGTDQGVWVYEPATGAVSARSAGLSGDLQITSLAASRNGEGPVLAATAQGNVYAWDEMTGSWSLALQTGLADAYAQAAVTPYFDGQAPPGPEQMLVAGVAGQLHVSQDGGASWAIQSQFATAAVLPTDWHITALVFAEDFPTSATLLVGRGRLDAASSSGTSGDLWRSTDAGASFSVVQSLRSSVRALAASGADGLGSRTMFLGVEAWPNKNNLTDAEGVFVSSDAGATWSDFGNFQDFLLESGTAVVTGVSAEEAARIGFGVSPDYANDGMVFFARSTGIFRSEDQGYSWRQVRSRPVEHVRTLAVTRDANGDILAFGGQYGSGMVKANITTMQAELLEPQTGLYNRDTSASSNFGLDGTVVVSDDLGVGFWFDPSKPPANPFGKTGWVADKSTLFRNGQTGQLSPLFDGSGTVPGSNRVLFWGTRNDGGLLRSHDGGLSFDAVTNLVGGSPAPWFRRMVIAPTYDPGSAATRTDVYAISGKRLFRLEDSEWNVAGQILTSIGELALDPSFSRPDNPRLFLSEKYRSTIYDVLDDPGNFSAAKLTEVGLGGDVRKIALAPDFATSQTIYVCTLGLGVVKLDLSSPTASWVPVGGPFPDLWSESLQLSPDFAADKTVVVGTQAGLLVGQDLPGASWTLLPADALVDNLDPGHHYYAPNEPANASPDRPWPWKSLNRYLVDSRYGVSVMGFEASYAATDGAYVDWEGYASSVELRTFAGRSMGSVTLTVTDFWTGVEIASTTADLVSTAKVEPASVSLSLPGSGAVRIRAEATLGPGQFFAYDGLRLSP